MSRERGVVEREVERHAPDGSTVRARDPIAVEEPLEIRCAGDPLAVTMRTPGDDRALALGFLFAEGLIASVDDVGSIAPCGRPGEPGFGNVLDVLPAPGVAFDPERLAGARRSTPTSAACGVCGRRSIDDLRARLPPVDEARPVARALLASAPEILASGQKRFARTGAEHAAAVLAGDGALLALAEDVGRHNAVDKVVGRLLEARRIGQGAVLVVSGRASFEIVQKAAVARLAAIAAVGAPTSLAIDLADRAGIVLAGFVRAGRMNVYTHPERCRTSSAGGPCAEP